MKNLLKKILFLNQSRTITRFHDLLASFNSLAPELLADAPASGSVVVFAPHCDDESLGCGGLLRRHSLAGTDITAVFMTDGAKCDAGGRNPADIAAIRKGEAERAAGIIGIKHCLFLGHPDRELAVDETTIGEARRILDERRPDIVYLPFYLDNHPDHGATAAIVLEALKRGSLPERIFMYEVWTTLVATHLADISAVIGDKMAALAVYRSQTDMEGMSQRVKSLNHFRSLASGNRFQFAEALFQVAPENIERILEQIHARQIV